MRTMEELEIGNYFMYAFSILQLSSLTSPPATPGLPLSFKWGQRERLSVTNGYFKICLFSTSPFLLISDIAVFLAYGNPINAV